MLCLRVHEPLLFHRGGVGWAGAGHSAWPAVPQGMSTPAVLVRFCPASAPCSRARMATACAPVPTTGGEEGSRTKERVAPGEPGWSPLSPGAHRPQSVSATRPVSLAHPPARPHPPRPHCKGPREPLGWPRGMFLRPPGPTRGPHAQWQARLAPPHPPSAPGPWPDSVLSWAPHWRPAQL